MWWFAQVYSASHCHHQPLRGIGQSVYLVNSCNAKRGGKKRLLHFVLLKIYWQLGGPRVPKSK